MYEEANELFESWSESKPKQVINFMVEYLAEDTYWLNSNISKVDRDTLISIGKYLEGSKTP